MSDDSEGGAFFVGGPADGELWALLPDRDGNLPSWHQFVEQPAIDFDAAVVEVPDVRYPTYERRDDGRYHYVGTENSPRKVR